MTGAITFINLVKTYGKQKAVSDLSIEIQKGRITGFLGPNGAGKPSRKFCPREVSNGSSEYHHEATHL